MFGAGSAHKRYHHHTHRGADDEHALHGCARCPADAIPLSLAPCGECLRLVSIEGGHMLRRRLAELGLNVGSEVRVLQSYGGGPMILAVKEDARMAIGRGMAHKILVCPVNNSESDE